MTYRRAHVPASPGHTRRRGTALEDALLDAAWVELTATGYAKLTIEGVAARAGTSKAVLYRRWRNRAELVVAAMRRRVVPITREVPDTGDLRQDVLQVLRQMRGRFEEIGPPILLGLMAELHEVPVDVFEVMPGIIRTLLQRAAERGQARLERVTPLVASLPGDLLRHQLLVTGGPVPDAFLERVVDEVFLPLVR